MHEHETHLEELERLSRKSAIELDRKLQTIKTLIKEQDNYINSAQELLNKRYNAKK
jgi:hypothetical protein